VNPRKSFCWIAIAAAAFLQTARANVITPENSGAPDVFTGESTGKLIAFLGVPFSISDAGGTLVSAVFEKLGGPFDFYYQIILRGTLRGPVPATGLLFPST
jgi:hypothetical protein